MNTSSKHITVMAIMALGLCSCRKVELHDNGNFDFDSYYSMPSLQQSTAADAGPDQTITLPLDSTYLDGSGSSPGGFAAPANARYRWTKLSGPTQYLQNAVTSLPLEFSWTSVVASRLVPGVYLFALTVEQPGSSSDTDTVQVTILDDPQNTNTLTYHNLIWQNAYSSLRSWQTTFLSTPARPDLWDPAGVHRRNLEFYFRPNSQSAWINVALITNTSAPYAWSGLPHVGLIVTQPDNPSLVGTTADIRIKIL